VRLRGIALVLFGLLVVSSCSFGPGRRPVYRAEFSRAVQVFPGVKVRVLGVNVGEVVNIRNVQGAAEVVFRLTDGHTSLPANVQAAVVPMSLLGERYIQLFPAYDGGAALEPGGTIPLARTAVPAEPDELLRSLQDYLGGLDSNTVTEFVENLAVNLRGNGAQLNRLIHNGTQVMETLNAKRDDLAGLVVELNKLTQALATRQAEIALLIQNYNAVAGTLNENRTSLEGTISGLNDAAVQLASLLIAHRRPLHADIKTLTRTGRTLSRNEESLARTGHWATRLFLAASRAADFDKEWLRLSNQGQELGALIILRLEERLMELCQAAHVPKCSVPQYWQIRVPSLFCFDVVCTGPKHSSPEGTTRALTRALEAAPGVGAALRERATADGTSTGDLVSALLDRTVGDPQGMGGFMFLSYGAGW
jgi:phospholipid/cholesterol/gamma-HCH transport system substrate-binding protein